MHAATRAVRRFFAVAALLVSKIPCAHAECYTDLNISVHFGTMTVASNGYELSNATIEVPYKRPSYNDTCPRAYLIDFTKPPVSGVGVVNTLGNESTACAATKSVMFNTTSRSFSDIREHAMPNEWSVTVRGDRATFYRTKPLPLHELVKCADSRESNGLYEWSLYVCQANVFSETVGLYTLACREIPVEVDTNTIISSSTSHSKSMELEDEASAQKSDENCIVFCMFFYILCFVILDR